MWSAIRPGLKRIVSWPLSLAGLAIVRTGADSAHTMPTWRARIEHMRELGFAPRVIFDGGAFKGLWSQEVAHVFPGAQIVLVEPNAHVHASIRRTIAHIQPPPRLVAAALGERPGRATLNIYGDAELATGASLLELAVGKARNALEVEVQTIDGVAQQTGLLPDLLKLDLQGAELAALRGATRALQHAEVALIEFGCLEAYSGRTTPRQLLDYMGDHGYALYDIVDLHYRPYDGALSGGDFVFVRADSPLRSYKSYR